MKFKKVTYHVQIADILRDMIMTGKLEEKFEQRDKEEYIRINNQYHSLVQEIADNRTLNQIVGGLRKKSYSIGSSLLTCQRGLSHQSANIAICWKHFGNATVPEPKP